MHQVTMKNSKHTISHLSDGSLTHQVHKKKTHIDQYLHTRSHHYLSQKYVVLKTLVTRAIQISAPQFLEKEKAHLNKALVANGYSISQINKAFHSDRNAKSKNPPTSSPLLAHLSLPHIQGTTDHISRILAKNNSKTYFKLCKTLEKLFKTAKDKSDPMLGP
jgi:hypothetical protein